jgi:acetyl-CoA carboxylase carboxyl transferase alpha subunit/acetyl-CoA carboxylase carboxyl transferase beta subunit
MPKFKTLFKKNSDLQPGFKKNKESEQPSVPEGLFVKCPKCQEPLYKEDVVANHYVCPKCNGYFRIKAKTRVRMVADRHTFKEWFTGIETKDPIGYPEYPQKIASLKEKTHLDEAVRIGEATMDGMPVVIGVMDARFLMGSMGYVVGEKITRSFEEATRKKLPVILFCCSGGARMQEGITSLMQMAKTSAAVKKHSEAGLLFISMLTDPTMGGVTASFAMLGDIILAEPDALIGFAGPRVIAQTIGQKLPEGFQRAEFLVEHGIIDGVVPREELKETLTQLIRMHTTGVQKDKQVNLEAAAIDNQDSMVSEDSQQEEDSFEDSRETEEKLPETAWDRVQIARSSERPTCLDYVNEIFDDFYELHGDRHVMDDQAIVGGLAYLEGKAVTVIGVQKGRTTKENIERNFGMPSPEGYRKALRLMRQAEKFNRPVICFVDTPGAFCGLEAEERGQGEAIARNLMEMSDLKIPVLSIVIGEGGSGGALALAVGNEVWMMENATYSILSPEGFASILWKDSKKAAMAAEAMKITAGDLYDMKIIEQVIPEETPASMDNLVELAEDIKYRMRQFFEKYGHKTPQELADQRYERFRRM